MTLNEGVSPPVTKSCDASTEQPSDPESLSDDVSAFMQAVQSR